MRIRSIVLLSSLAATLFASFVACTGDEAPTTSNGVDASADGKIGVDGTAPTGTDGSAAMDTGIADTGTDAPVIDSGTDAGPITLQLGSRLVLWLAADVGFAADGGGTLVWKDQSGKGNDAVQAIVGEQPIYFDGGNGGINGHGVIHFDGVAQHVSVPDNASLQWGATDYSVFVVERHTNASNNYALIYAKFTNAGNFPGPFLWASYPTSTGIVTRIAFDGNEVYSDGGFNDNTMRVVGMRRAGGDLQLHINGSLISDSPDGSISDEAGFNAVGIPAYIGGRPDLIQMMNGDIAEVIAVKGVVTDSELAQLQAYLKGKYGL